jgi:hypothetical protein
MFSRDFTVIKNYDVLNQEYISTTSIMPWRYTSVNSEQFLPVLPDDVKNTLNTAFNYKYINSTKVIEDELKFLQIDHVDDEILGYEVETLIETRHLFSYYDWLHFSSTALGIENTVLYDKMVEMTNTKYLESYINSIRYDAAGNPEGIYFFNANYILSEKQKSGDFFKITEFCDFYDKHSRDEIFLSPNGESLRTKLYFAYPRKAFSVADDFGRYKSNSIYTAVGMDVKNINRGPLNDGYLLNMIDEDIITEENLNYIQSLLLKNSRINFEFEWDEDYNMKKMILSNTVKYEFKDLEV